MKAKEKKWKNQLKQKMINSSKEEIQVHKSRRRKVMPKGDYR
jgi:hypothetical protein